MPMGLAKKAASLFRAKAEKIRDRLEDPAETLEYHYAEQQEMLTKVRRGVSDVTAARSRVEELLRARRLEAASDGQDGGTDTGGGLSELTAEYESLRAQEEKLAAAADRLEMKVENFRLRKEVIKANYAAGESRSRAAEMLSTVSQTMSDSAVATTSYLQQREMLAQLWSCLEGVQACREELEQHLVAVRSRQAELADQARQALDTGQPDLAQAASSQEAGIGALILELEENLRSSQAYEQELAVSYGQFAAKMENFRAEKENRRDQGQPG